jgi:hypothetical protein
MIRYSQAQGDAIAAVTSSTNPSTRPATQDDVLGSVAVSSSGVANPSATGVTIDLCGIAPPPPGCPVWPSPS